MSLGLVVQASYGSNRRHAGDMIQLGPPFIITENQIDDLVDILKRSIETVEQEMGIQS